MGWQTELLSEFDDDFRRGALATFEHYVDEVRQDEAMPRDTGKLAKGFQVLDASAAAGVAEATVASLARSADGADYGNIIDRASGKTITPKKKKALANVGSGWGPYASAKQSTKHVGWFDEVNSEANFTTALDRGMTPVNL